MFEWAQRAGTPPSGIVLETRCSTRIPNSQAPDPESRHIHHYRLFRKPSWRSRTPAGGIYNCFGHVFAGRRTAIYEGTAVLRILQDDGYRRLGVAETPYPGDLVLYRDPEDETNIHHAAEISGFNRTTGEPWVTSKWNDHFGEDRHAVTDTPTDHPPFRIEYWTDRP